MTFKDFKTLNDLINELHGFQQLDINELFDSVERIFAHFNTHK